MKLPSVTGLWMTQVSVWPRRVMGQSVTRISMVGSVGEGRMPESGQLRRVTGKKLEKNYQRPNTQKPLNRFSNSATCQIFYVLLFLCENKEEGFDF